MSAQLLHDPYSIDWQEVIAGRDGVRRDDDGLRSAGRRELGLGTAILIAAALEILLGAVVALVMASPHHHKQAHAAPMRVHLVSAPVRASRHPAPGARHRNPSAGRPGARSQSAKTPVSGGAAAGIVAAVSARHGLELSHGATAGTRQDSGHIRLNADCVSAQAGCLNAHQLRDYLQRLHVILQQRLAGLIKRDMPIGSGPVVLRFVGKPEGGAPARVEVLKAPTSNSAGRQLLLALQDTPLPSYPKGLGSRALSFKVSLHAALR